MRKLFLTISLIAAVVGAYAVPAKRGIWRTLLLAGGGEVRAELRGDEYRSYYVDASGKYYVLDAATGLYELSDAASIREEAQASRAKANTRRAAVRSRSGATRVTGEKKGLVILVEFSDLKFQAGHDKALFNNILNTDNYTSSLGFVGSVRDYFRAQSNGQLLIDFDVAGPVQMPRGYAYYGENTGLLGGDAHPDEMVVTACNAIADQVNFADYDWDGDGEVDQVCILFAGQNEAAGGTVNHIWSHEGELSKYGSSFSQNGVKVNTYACSSELNVNATLDGIGTFCHEFSHCLGLPDMYDTAGGSNYGMDAWDLMSYGNYNGDSFIPSGYTSYERWLAGWLEPIELTEDKDVSGMKPLEDGGDAYIIYNDGNRDEYYLLENRAKVGWDAAQHGEGLLVVHVDYDKTVWDNNMVNSSNATHQHCTPVAADNSYIRSVEQNTEDVGHDVYPYNGNNSLTDSSTPAATLYNRNTDGSYKLNKEITDITRNADGTISFSFRLIDEKPQPDENGNWFYESFNSCNGAGGNDGEWRNMYSGGSVSGFITDNTGWEGIDKTPGSQCAKVRGIITSPMFYFGDGSVVTFKAAPCRGEDTNLTLSCDMGTLSQTSFTMTDGEWTEFRATISGSGNTQLVFSGVRYFIDEVRVSDPSATGIENVTILPAKDDSRVYSLDGRYMGDSLDGLGKGIYIVNGRKVVK